MVFDRHPLAIRTISSRGGPASNPWAESSLPAHGVRPLDRIPLNGVRQLASAVDYHGGGCPQVGESPCEVVWLVVGVQSAWIWQHPNTGLNKLLGLPPETCSGTSKGSSVSSDPKEGDPTRCVAPDRSFKGLESSDQLSPAQLGRDSCRPIHKVREATA